MKIGKHLFVWEWPCGPMAWFFWNSGVNYRIGPFTMWVL